MMTYKLIFEEAVRSANRIAARQRFDSNYYCVIKNAMQEPLKNLLSHVQNENFYKIFQKRASFNWSYNDGAYKDLQFSQIDERYTTFGACRVVNSILDSLDYQYLSATSDDGSIESFNIYSNGKEKEQEILTSARINIDLSPLSAIKF